MLTSVCVSTLNQTVNLIPALQMGARKIYLVSSQEAEKRHWTANLKFVCKRRNISLQIISITPEMEMEPDKMADVVLPYLSFKEDVLWNISGGKKSMTIGMVNAYQQRLKKGAKNDFVIYTENRPYEIIRYTGFEFESRAPMRFFLDLEDILNLYGFTHADTGEKLNEATFPGWVAPFTKNYLHHDLFQELIAKCFAPRAFGSREKEPMSVAIRRILNNHAPRFNELISDMTEYNSHLKGNFGKAVDEYCSKDKSERNIAAILEPCNDFYWAKIKKLIIPALIEELTEPSQQLLKIPSNAIRKKDFFAILAECGISLRETEKQFLQSNVIFPEKYGALFEKIVTWEFYRTLSTASNIKQFIPHTYINIKTYQLEYGTDNEAMVPENIKERKNDDEFDLTIVMPWGALQIFEIKTFYGEGGDVLKSLRDSAMTKSGVFGRAIFIDHLIKSSESQNDQSHECYPRHLIEKREIIEGLGMQAWGFDEIESKLPKTLGVQ